MRPRQQRHHSIGSPIKIRDHCQKSYLPVSIMHRAQRIPAVILLCLTQLSSASAQSNLATAMPLSDKIWELMQGKSWHRNQGCPPRSKLVLLDVPYLGFDGDAHRGRLVVAKSIARELGEIFTSLYKADFKIKSMRLIDEFGGDDQVSMAADNTSAFNCRKIGRSSTQSAHARGLAVDINPVENPQVKHGVTEPPAGTNFDSPRKRSEAASIPGIALPDSQLVRVFKSSGWYWGGDWRSFKDYQHFSKDGR